MFVEILRAEVENRTVDGVNKAIYEATGDEDWTIESEEEELEKEIREGFIEFDGNELVIFADM